MQVIIPTLGGKSTVFFIDYYAGEGYVHHSGIIFPASFHRVYFFGVVILLFCQLPK